MKQKPTFPTKQVGSSIITTPTTETFPTEPVPIETGDAVDLFAEPTTAVPADPVIVKIEPTYEPTDADITNALLALLVGSQHNVSPATAIGMAKELVRQQHES